MAFGLNPTGLLTKLFAPKARRTPPPTDRPDDRTNYDTGTNATGLYGAYKNHLQVTEDRHAVLQDYEDMDFDDIPAAVLDAVAEECTQPDFIRDRPLWVKSENKDLEKMLEGLIAHLEIEDRFPSHTREVSKFGEMFKFIHTHPQEGIVGWEYFQPIRVNRIEEHGNLRGFVLDGEQRQQYSQSDTMTLPWQFTHFMRPSNVMREGARRGESWLRPARRIFRKFQMTEDSVIMYRLRKAPDRDVMYVDVGTAPFDQAVNIIRRWRRTFKKDTLYNPMDGSLRSDLHVIGPSDDYFVPRKEGSTTQIERLQGSSNHDQLNDYRTMLHRLYSALRASPDHFGFTENGVERLKPISNLSVSWSRGCRLSQKGVIQGYVKTILVHMALKGIDWQLPSNHFEIHTAPISYLDEQQRLEIYDIRTRLIEVMTRLTSEFQEINQSKWFLWLLYKFGGLSPEVLDQFIQNSEADGAEAEGLKGVDLTESQKRSLEELAMPYIGQIRDGLSHVYSPYDNYKHYLIRG